MPAPGLREPFGDQLSLIRELRGLCHGEPAEARGAAEWLYRRYRRVGERLHADARFAARRDAILCEIARRFELTGAGSGERRVLCTKNLVPLFHIAIFHWFGQLTRELAWAYEHARDNWVRPAIQKGIGAAGRTGAKLVIDGFRAFHPDDDVPETFTTMLDAEKLTCVFASPGYCFGSVVATLCEPAPDTPRMKRTYWRIVIAVLTLLDPDFEPESFGLIGLPSWRGPQEGWLSNRSHLAKELNGCGNKLTRLSSDECLDRLRAHAWSAVPMLAAEPSLDRSTPPPPWEQNMPSTSRVTIIEIPPVLRANARALSSQEEWDITALPDGVTLQSLTVLDAIGAIEIAELIRKNTTASPRGPETWSEPFICNYVGWFSPHRQPGVAGNWGAIIAGLENTQLTRSAAYGGPPRVRLTAACRAALELLNLEGEVEVKIQPTRRDLVRAVASRSEMLPEMSEAAFTRLQNGAKVMGGGRGNRGYRYPPRDVRRLIVAAREHAPTVAARIAETWGKWAE